MAISRIEIAGIPAADLDSWWPKIEKLCCKAIEKAQADFAAEDLKQWIADRDAQLWVAHEWRDFLGFCITRIITGKTKRLEVTTVGGKKVKDWIPPMNDVLERFGKANDCHQMISNGRTGWRKTVKNYGWQESSVIYTKGI